MEKLSGFTKKVMERDFRKAYLGHRNSYGGYVCLCLIPFLSACAALKKTAIVAGASSIGAGVGSVLSGSVGAFVGAATGATAGVLATGLGGSEKVSGQPLSVTADTVVQEAPSNFFDLLEQLVSMGGWLLILIFVVPMILGWIIPGRLKMHKRKKKS